MAGSRRLAHPTLAEHWAAQPATCRGHIWQPEPSPHREAEVSHSVGIDGVEPDGIQGRAPIVDHAVGDRVDSAGRYPVLVVTSEHLMTTAVSAMERSAK
jgi:hypothetical protein